uniref:AlNc14C18G1877 protein n=1 Tax=Albugo laibachii Nc14 TaxID=890382 RepID=F0W4Q6_9STRA|nr:AlNc14C18G1877 [Albugo laibachii Nc14]|eukprot:CCA16091.1 AlNc14C18G1877 [Albugo laibachii Nc14]
MKSHSKEPELLRRTRRSLLESLRPFKSTRKTSKSTAQVTSDENMQKASPCSTATTSSIQSLSEVLSGNDLSASVEACNSGGILSPLSRGQNDMFDSEPQFTQVENILREEIPGQSAHSVATFRQLRCSMSYRNQLRNSASRLSGNRQSGRRTQCRRSLKDEEAPIIVDSEAYDKEREDIRGEATLLALQTRRAFQRLVLPSSDDEETDGSRSERVSDCVEVSKEEFLRFQRQLLHVEELCKERDRQDAYLEQVIQRRVQAQLQEFQHTADQKLKIYKQEKDEECDRRIRKLFQPNSDGKMGTGQKTEGRMRRRRTFDKLFHSHRTKRSSESNEESSTRDTFCPTDFAEMDSLNAHDSQLAIAPREKLVEMITTLFEHSEVQARQLEEAKELITEALRSREEAEFMARDAVRLTLDLAAQLDYKDHIEHPLGSHESRI